MYIIHHITWLPIVVDIIYYVHMQLYIYIYTICICNNYPCDCGIIETIINVIRVYMNDCRMMKMEGANLQLIKNSYQFYYYYYA